MNFLANPILQNEFARCLSSSGFLEQWGQMGKGKVKVLISQSCLTLCDPMDCSPPGSSVHGTLQARILEWVSIPFSRGSSQSKDRTQASCTGRWILYHLSHQDKGESMK